MNRENQIYLLKKFIKSNEDTIVINQVNENITILYLYFIRYFADKQGVKINTNINTETKVIENDLFGINKFKFSTLLVRVNNKSYGYKKKNSIHRLQKL